MFFQYIIENPLVSGEPYLSKNRLLISSLELFRDEVPEYDPNNAYAITKMSHYNHDSDPHDKGVFGQDIDKRNILKQIDVNLYETHPILIFSENRFYVKSTETLYNKCLDEDRVLLLNRHYVEESIHIRENNLTQTKGE